MCSQISLKKGYIENYPSVDINFPTASCIGRNKIVCLSTEKNTFLLRGIYNCLRLVLVCNISLQLVWELKQITCIVKTYIEVTKKGHLYP